MAPYYTGYHRLRHHRPGAYPRLARRRRTANPNRRHSGHQPRCSRRIRRFFRVEEEHRYADYREVALHAL